eukprot:TRINITY_DN620_c1_g1_i1.p1 TRINITY_DN620_c1_g1~~TRINITY_DN620_c1_g1_i1.p1  ORF type:complete len:289 (-),score=74.27 TRINITY_DN620_c1_g1_i1:11-856(-)
MAASVASGATPEHGTAAPSVIAPAVVAPAIVAPVIVAPAIVAPAVVPTIPTPAAATTAAPVAVPAVPLTTAPDAQQLPATALQSAPPVVPAIPTTTATALSVTPSVSPRRASPRSGGGVSLLHLPRDILMRIIVHCDNVRDFANLGATCTYLDDMFDIDELWQRLFQKRWRSEMSPLVLHPREYFVTRYLDEKAVRVAFDPTAVKHDEFQDLFAMVTAFKPRDFDLPTVFKPFIPDYEPTLSDPDPFLNISRPDRVNDHAGAGWLAEHKILATGHLNMIEK